MVGSAIGSVGAGIMGSMFSDDADEMAAMADAEVGVAKDMYGKSLDTIKGNQTNVDALQNFLTSMGDKGIEFAQGLLDDWESTFGGIQDNLSEYYNNLDPDKFALQKKVAFKDNMDAQLKQYNEMFATSGMQTAGMKAQTAKEAAFKMAEMGAKADIEAPEQVAQMKKDFLTFGDPQRAGAQNAMSQGMSNQASYGMAGHQAQTEQASREATAYNTAGDQAMERAKMYGESAAGYGEASGNMFGSAIKMGLSLLP